MEKALVFEFLQNKQDPLNAIGDFIFSHKPEALYVFLKCGVSNKLLKYD